MLKRIFSASLVFLLAIFSVHSASFAAIQIGIETTMENKLLQLDTTNLNWWLSDHWALRGNYSWKTDDLGIAALYKLNPKGRASLYLGLGAEEVSAKADSQNPSASQSASPEPRLIAGMEWNLSSKPGLSLMVEAEANPYGFNHSSGNDNGSDTRLALSLNYKFSPSYIGKENHKRDTLELLAKLITIEAPDEPFEGQVAVAAVVLNRTRSHDFPDSVSKVIYQPGQFATAQRLTQTKPTDSAVKAAGIAIRGNDPSHGALYFYNPATSSARARRYIQRSHFQVTARIGNHVFFK